MFSATDPDSIFPTAKQQVISWVVRRRVHLSSILFALLISENFASGFTPHDITNPRDALSMIGLLLVGAGLVLRTWAAGVLQKTSKLTTTGPYSLIRNPLYVGSSAMVIGFFTLIDEPVNWIALCPFMLLLYYSAQREERSLAKRFGKRWSEYTKSTPRFIPHRVTPVAGNWRVRQWIVNREYQALIAAVLGLVALQAWQTI